MADFDLKALYEALDTQRREKGLTWAAATREINRFKTAGHPIATSTITGLKDKAAGEGDGILQMLLWLGRTPESFVPDIEEPNADRYRLRVVDQQQTLRFDAKALHAALDAQRKSRDLSWDDVARQLRGFTPAM